MEKDLQIKYEKYGKKNCVEIDFNHNDVLYFDYYDDGGVEHNAAGHHEYSKWR